MRLANKVAIITGGGSGIGKASAHLFAKEGAKVVIAQRTAATGEETAAAIKSSGGEAIFVRADVTVASDAENLVRTTVDRFGKINMLFNNAGLTQQRIPLEEIEESLWDQIYAANVKSIFLLSKYAIPEMKRGGGGVIINTSSISGVRPRPLTAAYSSSKGAVIILTKAMALDVAEFNIRVNCINPVAMDTPLMRYSAEGLDWEQLKKQIEATIPLGHRMADPQDMAYAALYLASDESAMVTGICINVDGGRGI